MCQRPLGEGEARSSDQRLAATALAAIRAAPVELLPASGYVAAAQTIAFNVDQRTPFTSLRPWRASLITADQAFAATAARHGVYASAVKLLGE